MWILLSHPEFNLEKFLSILLSQYHRNEFPLSQRLACLDQKLLFYISHYSILLIALLVLTPYSTLQNTVHYTHYSCCSLPVPTPYSVQHIILLTAHYYTHYQSQLITRHYSLQHVTHYQSHLLTCIAV